MLELTFPTDDFIRTGLGRLHRCAYDAYVTAQAAGFPIQVYTMTGAADDGLVCLIWEEAGIFVYAAFAESVDEAALQPHLEAILWAAIRERAGRWLDCTVYGRHATLINAVRKLGFREQGDGLEFCYTAEQPLPDLDLGPLRTRPFAATPIMPYLELLDLAFNPLKLPHDWRTTIFRRDVAGATRMLMNRNRNGDFAAFWLGERLIGLYYVTGNVLETIAVHPDFQGRGYGTRILHHCMHDLLQKKEYDAMYLYVTVANEGARRFYRRHGFAVSAAYSRHTYVES